MKLHAEYSQARGGWTVLFGDVPVQLGALRGTCENYWTLLEGLRQLGLDLDGDNVVVKRASEG